MAAVQTPEATVQPTETLRGRVALVTGGTRGIGAAICRGFANQQATVAAGYSRDREKAEAFKSELEQLGTHPSLHQGNVASADDCKRTVREVIEQHGRIDILVNNAGITADSSILKMGE